ncbi:MAG: hypothetical protein ACK5PF_09115 [bacterium]|jgi:hypothetical protein
MTIARDSYREYYSEKLWEWLPAIYRELDGLDSGQAQRAFLKALATQAALLKRSQDRLWDDMFVELADDWAIPYLAQLVATRLVSALNPRARRADVAKTIYYRRRKGTLMVLEQLIADMTGWDGKVVEEFRRLGRMRHGLDGLARVGRLTATPEGGWANLHHVRGGLLTHDAFDEFHYTPDMRRPKGLLEGRRGINKLSFHLYHLQSVELIGVQPRRMQNLPGGRDTFTFDPSGRDITLFCANDPARDWSEWSSAQEWALPRPMTCRLLNETIYSIGDEEIAWILSAAPIATLSLKQAAAADLRKLKGQHFMQSADLRRVLAGLPSGVTLTAPGVFSGLLDRGLVSACGNAALLPDSTGNAAFGAPALQLGILSNLPTPREKTRAANLITWSAPTVSGVDWWVDPERGRFLFNLVAGQPADNLRVRYRTGMLGPVGAGAFTREISALPATVTWQNGSSTSGTPANGVVEIVDSATYLNPPDRTALQNTTVRAREGQRPYVRLQNHWRLTATGNNRHLILDGLWLGGRPYGDLWLDGNFETVTIRYCTLDPGGLDALGAALSPCELVVLGFVEKLIIENSILANIRLNNATASIESIEIQDSIIHAATHGVVAINCPRATLQMKRTTVIGADLSALTVDVERLDATDSLIAGRVDVTDTQNGCFRFSARASGSRVPHPYESQVLTDMTRLFRSRRFGDRHYAQLSEVAPQVLTRGAENGSEMGVFNRQIIPIKQDSLRVKVEEYLPFGRLPNFIINH